MRSVLIIDEKFPYTGGSRTEKIVKHFYRYRWNAIILTVNQEKINSFASELYDNLKNKKIKLYSTKKLPTFINLKNYIQSRYCSILDRIFFVPDTNVAWFPFAIAKAKQIFKKNKIDIIYSTSPNEGVHILAYLLKCQYGKPWVADFRDLWTFCYGRYKPLTVLHHKVNWHIEKNIYTKWSDMVIANTKENKNIMIRETGAKNESIKVITNGFDSDEMHLRPSKCKNDKLTFGFFGALIKPMSCHESFLNGMEGALTKNSKIQLRIWAVLNETQKDELRKNRILRNHLSFEKYSSHQTCMKQLAQCDVLVVLLKNEFPYVVPQKLYNYLAIKKPILAIVPPNGSAAKIIHETNSGIVVSPNDIERITEVILNFATKWKNNAVDMEYNKEAVKQYQIEYKTKSLCDVFDGLLVR